VNNYTWLLAFVCPKAGCLKRRVRIFSKYPLALKTALQKPQFKELKNATARFYFIDLSSLIRQCNDYLLQYHFTIKY
jgi:hypothetical protein